MPKDELNTILSSRDYRCDAVYTICLWGRTASPPYPVETIKTHLANPAFVLYLGRKSCPLSLPVHAQIARAENLAEALKSVQFPDHPFISRLTSRNNFRVFWEGNEQSGFEEDHTVIRRDDPSSRRRWQFADREEHYAMITTSRRSLTMLISRVRLRPDAAEKKEFWEHVDSAYHMHSLIWDLFTDGPERKRDFIYRQDAVHGLPAFFCVSDRCQMIGKGSGS